MFRNNYLQHDFESVKRSLLSVQSELNTAKYENMRLQREVEKYKKLLKEKLSQPSHHKNQIPAETDFFNQMTCVVCMTNLKTVVFAECRHLVSCRECLERLGHTCPICRKESKVKMSIYL